MTAIESPSLQRRRLRTELRKARNATGLDTKEVAKALDWSQSKLFRIENGDVGVSTTDIRALLVLYGINDTDRAAAFVRWAQGSRKLTWAPYSDILTSEFIKYLDLESDAVEIRNYENFFVPGLLQTPDYARSVIGTIRPDNPSETTVDRALKIRMERKEILQRDDPPPPHTMFIVDESVIRRAIGGPEVMREQLEHLRTIATGPNVSFRLIPFSRGLLQSMTSAFAILEFKEDDGLVYIESEEKDFVTRDDPEEITRFLDDFVAFEDAAATEAETLAILDEAAAQL